MWRRRVRALQVDGGDGVSGPDHEVSGKEQSLRYAIVATPILAAPIPPAALVGIHFVWVIFTILASISGGYAVLFYAVWLLGVIEGGSSSYRDNPQLIGDDDFYAPPLYWPWGSYQRRIRKVRRIRAIEREVGIHDPYPIG